MIMKIIYHNLLYYTKNEKIQEKNYKRKNGKFALSSYIYTQLYFLYSFCISDAPNIDFSKSKRRVM